MHDAFAVQKGHIKCTGPQKEAHLHPFFVLIFYLAMCVHF